MFKKLQLKTSPLQTEFDLDKNENIISDQTQKLDEDGDQAPKSKKGFLSGLTSIFKKSQDKIDQEQYLYRYNKDRALKSEKQIISCISESSRSIMVNDTFSKIYYLSQIPDFFDSSLISSLLNSGLPLNLSYFIEGTDKSNIIKALRFRNANIQGTQESRTKRGSDLDPHLEKERDEIDKLLLSLIKGGQRSFNIGIYVTIKTDSQEKLNQYAFEFQQLAKSMELGFEVNSFNQLNSLPAILPLGNDTIKESRNVLSEAVTEMFPFLSKNIQDNNGFFIGTSQTNLNSLVIIDPFASHIRNANIVILGTSGSGKSVTSKSFLTKFAMRKIQSIILDPEGEYTNITKQLGGTNVIFGKEEIYDPKTKKTTFINKGLNIFNLDFVNDESRRNHIAVLKNFFKFIIDAKRYSDSDLDYLITKFYSITKYSKDLNIAKFVKLAQKENSEFCKDLLKLTQGSYAGIFDNEQRLDFHNSIINFDLKNLGNEDLKIPTMYLIASIVDNLINRADQKRMIFIDEAHLFLNRDFTREFYIRLQKTARKRKAGVVSITQNAEDYREENGGKTILTQAETVILLKQHSASVNYLMNNQIFSLNPNELKMLSSFDRGEAILFREQEHMLIKIEPLASEWQFIQT